MSSFLGEFFGTLILTAIGVGVGAGVNLSKTFSRNQNWLFVSLGWGLGISFGVYVAGTIGSKGFINPAITLGTALCGLFPWGQVLPYLIGEFLGAFCGAGLVIGAYYAQFKHAQTEEEGNTVSIFATSPAIEDHKFNFVSELIATFIFVFILLNLGSFTTGLKPLIVGLIITAIGMAFGGTTGFAVNPARDLGPRLAYALLPIPNKGDANWKYAWVPIAGPIVGGFLACLLKVLV
ncbi:MIP/aquaporin family protein [Ligilactobacillus sp. LYQ60]|uniref:MIP/aquaporin family protein n=1 Tax=unclassified Ligilactobacillus TaxID=2767920 RepID=UPI00385215F4